MLGFRLEQFDNQILTRRTHGDALASKEHFNFDKVGVVDGHRSLSHPSDLDRSTAEKARSYLHVNCAPCHQGGDGGDLPLDLRFKQTADLTQLYQKSYVDQENPNNSLNLKRMKDPQAPISAVNIAITK